MNKKIAKPTAIELAEYTKSVWQIMPTVETKIEDLLNPDYWAHVARKVNPGDRIEAIPEDRHYFAEFFVLAASTNWIKVKLLRKVVLIEDNDNSTVAGYNIQFAGAHKWRIRMGDEVLSKGHDDKEAATNWLMDHMKTVR